jgi:tetratricopeptide (TPR) repeat protein
LKLQPDLLPARLFLGAANWNSASSIKQADSLALVVAAKPAGAQCPADAGRSAARNGPTRRRPLRTSRQPPNDYPQTRESGTRSAEPTKTLGRDPAAAWDKLHALPPSIESHLHAAQVHDAAQRWREAAVEWRAAIEKPAARIGLAWSLFRARDYDAAMAALKPLLASGGDDVQFLYGATLLNQQQPEAAIPYLRSAVKLVSARSALGQALLQTGKPEEAIPLLKDGLAADTDGTVHFQLYRAYQLTHREAEAREALAAYKRSRTGKI